MFKTVQLPTGEVSWPAPSDLFERIEALYFVDSEGHEGIPARKVTLELSGGMWLFAAWQANRHRLRRTGDDQAPTDAEFEALDDVARTELVQEWLTNYLTYYLQMDEDKVRAGRHPIYSFKRPYNRYDPAMRKDK